MPGILRMHGAQYSRTDRDRLGHGLGPTRRSRRPRGTFWIGHRGARVGLVRRAAYGFAASILRVNHQQAAAHDQPRLDGCAASARPLADSGCVNDLQQRHAMVDRRQLREQRQAAIALSSKTSTRIAPSWPQ